MNNLFQSKHKVFISYYHKDDQLYRDEFERLFGHLFISKSVKPGDIETDASDDYIKRLIQKDFISDASVVIVLIGPKTLCRKHVDWEISAGLNKKLGGHSGLFGILLPTHPDYKKSEFQYSNIPARLADNCKTKFAFIGDWPSSETIIQDWIENSFNRRTSESEKIDNSRVQMTRNTCD